MPPREILNVFILKFGIKYIGNSELQLFNRHCFIIGDARKALTESRRDMCRQSMMTFSQSGYRAGTKPGVVLVL